MSYFTCSFFFFNTTALSFNFYLLLCIKPVQRVQAVSRFFFFLLVMLERKVTKNTYQVISSYLPRSSTGDFLSQRFIHLRAKQLL